MWFASYDAPYHGLASMPYRGAVYAEMDAHVMTRHARFMRAAHVALGGTRQLQPREWRDAVARFALLLGLCEEDAVRLLFKAPELLAYRGGAVASALVRLRRERGERDLSMLVTVRPELLVALLAEREAAAQAQAAGA